MFNGLDNQLKRWPDLLAQCVNEFLISPIFFHRQATLPHRPHWLAGCMALMLINCRGCFDRIPNSWSCHNIRFAVDCDNAALGHRRTAPLTAFGAIYVYTALPVRPCNNNVCSENFFSPVNNKEILNKTYQMKWARLLHPDCLPSFCVCFVLVSNRTFEYKAKKINSLDAGDRNIYIYHRPAAYHRNKQNNDESEKSPKKCFRLFFASEASHLIIHWLGKWWIPRCDLRRWKTRLDCQLMFGCFFFLPLSPFSLSLR